MTVFVFRRRARDSSSSTLVLHRHRGKRRLEQAAFLRSEDRGGDPGHCAGQARKALHEREVSYIPMVRQPHADVVTRRELVFAKHDDEAAIWS